MPASCVVSTLHVAGSLSGISPSSSVQWLLSASVAQLEPPGFAKPVSNADPVITLSG